MSRYQQLMEMIQDPGADCIKWPYAKNSHGYGVSYTNIGHIVNYRRRKLS